MSIGLASLLSAAALLQPPPIATVVPPGPASAMTAAQLVEWTAGAVECGDGPAVPQHVEPPFATSIRQPRSPSPSGAAEASSITIGFSIDAAGRPMGIKRAPAAKQIAYFVDQSDLEPSLAAWRFAGAPREQCRVTFTSRQTPIALAEPAALYRLLAGPTPGDGAPAAQAQVTPAGADCSIGRKPNVRSANSPAFETIDGDAGSRSWSYLGYDIDAAGRTAGVRVLGSSRNAVLDRTAVTALARNRYQPGVRRGCSSYFFRQVDLPQAMPDRSPLTAFRRDGDSCDVDLQALLDLRPAGAFPFNFLRRRIEGSAVVRFDVATWGAIGNVEVVRSEPAAAFGLSARSLLERSRARPNPTGYRGCLRAVNFRVADTDDVARNPPRADDPILN